MGKVRPVLVKRLARELLSRYPDKFTLNFDENKRLVAGLTDIKSKRLRNRVAGYITRLVRIQLQGESEESEEELSSDESSGFN